MTSLYVDKFYVCQTEFEDIVFGDNLQDGMIVLIEDSLIRENLEHITGSSAQHRADEMNRWCEVTELKVTPRYDTPSPLIKFVGVYPDGTKRVRTFCASYGWIVKKAAAGSTTPKEDTDG
jgi:hypothetical protein